MLVSCPTTHPPAGVLYNHVSKTGGTELIRRLKALLKSPDMPWVKVNSREGMSQVKLGRDGALVVQADTSPVQVSASDAARFFVIGLVRRPCDYARSVWSFRSGRCAQCSTGANGTSTSSMQGPKYCWLRAVCESGIYGSTPPYTSASDLARFESWVLRRPPTKNTSVKARVRTGSPVSAQAHMFAAPSGLIGLHEDGLTGQLTLRLGAANLSAHVHCWVRTHEMDAGLVACLEAYGDTCGGRLSASQRVRLHHWREAQKQQPTTRVHAKTPTNVMQSAPTASGQACSSYFTAGATAAVLSRDADLIDRFGLESCCSN